MSSVLALPGLSDDKSGFRKHAKKLLEKHCAVDVAEWQAVDDREAQLALQSTRKSVETRLAFCKEKEMMFKKRQEELRKHVLDNQILSTASLVSNYRALIKGLHRMPSIRFCEYEARYKDFLEHVIQESREEFGDDIEVSWKQRFSQFQNLFRDATDIKFAPVRGDKGDTRLEESSLAIL
eukprot:Skav220117  [mRNA]  locus=scaffold1078:1683:17008:- [translate_table: standard]